MDEIEVNGKELNNPKHHFKIKCDSKDEFNILGRPCELSAFSFVPENRKYEPVERSIYNSKTNTNHEDHLLDYDRLFNVNYDFNNKVHRDDRKHAKIRGLDAWSEEVHKEIPTRSSGEYGKHLLKLQTDLTSKKPAIVKYESNLDPPTRKYTRIATVQSEFYNRNGINDLNKQRGVL